MRVVLAVAFLSLFTPPAHAGEVESRRAVDGALRWLAERQLTEGADAGAWETARPEYRPATAALAGLAFLAHGHTPAEGQYATNVTAALRYVMGRMAPDGYLGQGDPSGMYIHAIGMLFGLSALGMTGDAELDRQLAAWCERGTRVIVEAHQVRRAGDDRGGWRYTPHTSESDVSVTVWQLAALHSARQCGFAVPPEVIEDGLRYLRGAWRELDGGAGGYLYRPGVDQQPKASSTGAALFIRAALDEPDEARQAAAMRLLERQPPGWGGGQHNGFYFFSTFYLAQGVFQVGGAAWETYRAALRATLLAHQAGDGRWPLPPDNAAATRLAGPAYPTAMGALLLALDRQYLPLFQRQRPLF